MTYGNTTKVFYDFEFLERGYNHPIAPISVGMVDEEGEECYLINGGAPWTEIMEHDFLRQHVVPTLPITVTYHKTVHEDGIAYSNPGATVEWLSNEETFCPTYGEFRRRVRQWLEPRTAESGLELWGDYAAVDHILLSQCMGSQGTFVDRPPWMPMRTNDLAQLLDHLGRQEPYVPFEGVQHVAIADARHIRAVYMELMRGAGLL